MHADKTFFQTVCKPLRIESRNVRPLSCIDNHDTSPPGSASFHKFLQYFAGISVDTERPLFALVRAECLVIIQAGIGGIRPLLRHLPKRHFKNNRRIGSHPCLQEEHMLPIDLFQKFRISGRRMIPSFILHKAVFFPLLRPGIPPYSSHNAGSVPVRLHEGYCR